ncbi:hypothetical protein [Streptomyces cyaneofuscatus]
MHRLLLFAVLPPQPLRFLALGTGQLAAPPFIKARLRAQPRKDSELMQSTWTTAVTVSPGESTSAIASRLNSSVYRFVYLPLAGCYFLWNLRSSQVSTIKGKLHRRETSWSRTAFADSVEAKECRSERVRLRTPSVSPVTGCRDAAERAIRRNTGRSSG